MILTHDRVYRYAYSHRRCPPLISDLWLRDADITRCRPVAGLQLVCNGPATPDQDRSSGRPPVLPVTPHATVAVVILIHGLLFNRPTATATTLAATITVNTLDDGTALYVRRDTNTVTNATTVPRVATTSRAKTIRLLFGTACGVESSEEPHMRQYSARIEFRCSLWQSFTSKLDPHCVQNADVSARNRLQL
jgi:hypothetical protein